MRCKHSQPCICDDCPPIDCIFNHTHAPAGWVCEALGPGGARPEPWVPGSVLCSVAEGNAECRIHACATEALELTLIRPLYPGTFNLKMAKKQSPFLEFEIRHNINTVREIKSGALDKALGIEGSISDQDIDIDDQIDEIADKLQELYHMTSDECPDKHNILKAINALMDTERIWEEE